MFTMQGYESVSIPFFDGSGNSPLRIDKEFFELDLNVPLDHAVAITVPDSSMSHKLQHGGTCVLNRKQLTGNGLFAMRVGGIMKIRKLQTMRDGAIQLTAENPQYADTLVSKEEGKTIEILGRVIWYSQQ